MSRKAESTEVHTAILRCTLAADDARAYWAIPDPGPAVGRVDRAFKGFWFGARSHARVEVLLANFSRRFDAWPEALAVLRDWPHMEPATRTLVCHWHLQLSDPLYRTFTGEFLPKRRAEGRSDVTRAQVLAWMGEQDRGRWTTSTRIMFASKLLSAAFEAGLLGSARDPRPLRTPKVPDEALLYLLHLLRGVEIAGTLLENPYLASVGMVGDVLTSRLRTLPGLRFAQQGGIADLSWQHDSLRAWSAAAREAAPA